MAQTLEERLGQIEPEAGSLEERLRQSETPAPPAAPFSPQIPAGALDVLGAFVDVPTGLANRVLPESMQLPPQFMGSESLKGMFRWAGMDVAEGEPQTPGQWAAYGVGAGLGGLIPITKGAQLLGRLPGLVGQIGRMMSGPFTSAPVASTATEIAAGGGAGLASGVAAEETDNPLLQSAAGLAGGLMAGVGTGALVTGLPSALRTTATAPGMVRQVVSPRFTRAGSVPRLGQRMRELAADPEAVRAGLSADNPAGLTPAQLSGDERLMALERVTADMSPQLTEARRTQLEGSGVALREETLNIGGRDTQELLAGVQERSEARLMALEPEARAAESSAVYRQELDTAYSTARERERGLWEAVPQDVEQPMENAYSTWERFQNEPPANRGDVPAETRFFARRPGFNIPEGVDPTYAAIVDDTVNSRLTGIAADIEGGSRRGVPRLEDQPGGFDRPYDATSFEEIYEATGRTAGGQFQGSGLRSAYPELTDIPESPAQIARAIRSGRGALYGRIRDAARSLVEETEGDAIRAFIDEGPSALNPSVVTMSVRDAHAAYSKLRESARVHRSGDTPNRNAARLETELADAIWADLMGTSGTGEVAERLNAARSYSRELNETFTQGYTGRILGFERTGAGRIAPELTLEGVAGRTGATAAVRANELARAVRFGAANGQRAEEAIQDMMRRRFTEAANKDRFMTANAPLLERYPELNTQMRRAIEGEVVTARLLRMERTLADVMNSPNPTARMEGFIREAAASDPASAQVIRGGLVEHMFRTGRFDPDGHPVISGQRVMEILNNPAQQAAVRQVLTGDEVLRLETIARHIRNLEVARRADSPLVKDVMGGQPILVAAIGRIVGTEALSIAGKSGLIPGSGGAGVSLQRAQMASGSMRRLALWLARDKGVDLAREMTFDQQLYDSIFNAPPPGALQTLAQWVRNSPLAIDAMAEPAIAGILSETMAETSQGLQGGPTIGPQ